MSEAIKHVMSIDSMDSTHAIIFNDEDRDKAIEVVLSWVADPSVQIELSDARKLIYAILLFE